ncbi:MAG: PA14 domain-containing protein [Anaerohalosphaeraceae bacterium]
MNRWGIVWIGLLIFAGIMSGAPSNPQPAVGESVDPDMLLLQWTPDADAVRSEIYLGTSAAAVAAAQKPSGDVDGSGTVDILDLVYVAAQWLDNPSSPCPDLDYSGWVDLADAAEISRRWMSEPEVLYLGAAAGNSFEPGQLIPNKTYYWRVDTVRCGGIEKGPVWSFKTKRPAFPGAEGFGKWASGGRGGSVYHVTNLNDSGPGSFRDAVSAPNRTVVFDVGGVIRIIDRIVVSKDITIAGQTAPGEGVVIYGNGLSYTDANRTITRHMRYRMGKVGTSGKDAVTIADGTNMIFDHCSISWGRDETFSISGGTGEDPGFVTIQNCIIAQGLQNHSCGGLIQNFNGVSLFRNLYIDNNTRNPKVKGINEFINNVVYNWGVAAYILGDSEADSYANVIRNYFISGPNTSSAAFTRGNLNFHIYALNNWHDSNRNGVLDGAILEQAAYGTVDWQTVPYNYPGVRTMLGAPAAYKVVASRAGAFFPIRDRIDTRLIKELRSLGTSGQLISDENAAPMYGVGILDSGICPTDTDQDGMPDYWELSIAGLNPYGADHNGDADGNGYTNLEDYLNFLAVPHAHVQKNRPRDINLRRFTSGFDTGAVYTVFDAQNGTVQLLSDGSTARFTPNPNYIGPACFRYTVNDGQVYTDTVLLLVSEYGGHPLPPKHPSGLVQGLNYKYYTGTFEYLPDFALLTPAQQGTIANFDISGAPAPDSFAYVFEGFIEIPADGLYTFYLNSDDGSKLYIDGGIVVSNDGVHGTQEAEGSAALLAGMHAIRVTYFEKDGNQRLEVRWAGPGFSKQLISNSVLYRGLLDTVPPAAPTGVWAAASNAQVVLQWKNNTEADLAGYNVYRTTVSGGGYVRQNDTLLHAPIFLDSSVSNGTLYHYAVTAVDESFNESQRSYEVSARPADSNDICLLIQELTAGFCLVEGTVDNNNAGFTGYGFANGTNAVGKGINWSVSVGQPGTYQMVWRFANGTTSNRPANLMINGAVAVSGIAFGPTGSWTTWSEVSCSVVLGAGTHLVRLDPTTSNGLANIDYLMITGPDVVPAACQ